MTSRDAIRREKRVFIQSYARHPLALAKAKGAYVWDEEGRRYLDFFTGISVNSIGHSNSRVLAAVKAQAGRITHVGNLFYSGAQIELAEWLVGHSFAKRLAFTNTGAEANELCIKLARKWGLKR